jgi:hypothetical protein
MAGAVRTLADFVAACEDFDETQELADLSAAEMQVVLEEFSALLKDGSRTAGRKQRENLLAEHSLLSGQNAVQEGVQPAPAQVDTPNASHPLR